MHITLPDAMPAASAPPHAEGFSSDVQPLSARGSALTPRRGTSRLRQTSKKLPRTPRSVAGPWFDPTSHDLARNKSWATEWLSMGAQEEDPTNPDFAQLLQQSAQQGSVHQQSVPQAMQQQATQQLQQSRRSPMEASKQLQQSMQISAQRSEQQLLQQSRRQSKSPPVSQPAQQTLFKSAEQAQQVEGNLHQNQALLAPAASQLAETHDYKLSGSRDKPSAKDEVRGRPWTAPESLLKAATSPWVLDVRRLHSARPGSGGSPTARYIEH